MQNIKNKFLMLENITVCIAQRKDATNSIMHCCLLTVSITTLELPHGFNIVADCCKCTKCNDDNKMEANLSQ